jgi:hypothetical protein
MKKDKWKLVGGRVYRLADIFDNMYDAAQKAKELKENNRVFLSKIDQSRWAVYFRPKDPNVECGPKQYSVA